MKTALSIEESARLIDLGVDAKLASKDRYDFDANGNEYREYRFTLSDLLSILPKRITDRRKIYSLTIEIADCLDGDDKWCISYRNMLDMDELDSFQSAEELIDAIYAEIVWFKENPELVWL